MKKKVSTEGILLPLTPLCARARFWIAQTEPFHGCDQPKDCLFEAGRMSWPCISFTDAIRLNGALTCCEYKSSLKTVRIVSTIQFLCTLLDCKTICFVRPQLVQFFWPARTFCCCNHYWCGLCLWFVVLQRVGGLLANFRDEDPRAVHSLRSWHNRGSRFPHSKGLWLNCEIAVKLWSFSQLSHNPVDYKKRDPRLRQDFKIPKLALWIVEAPRAWVGACPRLQTQNLSVGR